MTIKLRRCNICKKEKANVIWYAGMPTCEPCFENKLIPHAEEQVQVMKRLLEQHKKPIPEVVN